MNSHWKFAAMLLLCVATTTTLFADANSTATVAPFAKAPTIDGKIDAGEWDGAIGTVGFQNIVEGMGRFLDARTGRTMVGFHGDRLYIAVVSELPPTGVLARKANRDAELVMDDGLEIWLDSNRDRRESKDGDQSYYQIICNPLGSFEDKRFDPSKGAPDGSWDGHWEFANNVDNEHHIWTAEMSLPFADLGWKGDPAGRSMGVLISRNYKLPWDQATWFPHNGAFVSWYEYPRIVLTKDSPSVQVTSLGDRLYDGVLQLRATIFNPGPARKANVDLFITSSDMPEMKDKKTLDLPAMGAMEYAFDVPEDRLHAHGQHALQFKVDSSDGQTIMNLGRRWTNVFDTMKKVNPAGAGKKWDVHSGPNPDAAVVVAHYPTYNFVRVKVDTRELEKDADAIKHAKVVIADPSGKLIASGEMNWKDAPAEQEFPITGKMPEGESTITVTLDGRAEPFVRKVTRKYYPWEGNTLGITDKVLPPFEPVQVKDQDVSVVLRTYHLSGLGLWDSVKAAGNVSAGPAKELLAAPIAMKINQGETLAGAGKFTKQAANEAVYEGEATHSSVTVKSRATTEYDGCTKFEFELLPGTEKGKELSALWVEIPLQDTIAPFFHCTTTSLRVNPSIATPPGDGDVWDSRKFPDGEWTGNFKPYLWLGGEERGLCFFADNDKGWVLKLDEQQPAQSAPCLVLHREKGVLTLRLNLVQKPIIITEPRKITFGLMATPAKPMAKDWRKVTFAPTYKDYPSIAWMGSEYWGSDAGFGSKHPRHGDLTILDRFRDSRLGVAFDRAAFLKEWEAAHLRPDQPLGQMSKETHLGLLNVTLDMASRAPGPQFRFNAYWEEFSSTNGLHEEMATFANEWGGTYGFASTCGIVPSYRDFAVWWGAQFIRRGCGLYFDNACPMRAYDPLTTSAYKMENGKIQPSAGMWARREYLKRIWVIHRTEADPRLPIIQMIHMTNTHIAPYMVWNESNLDLEWFYGPEAQQSKYSHELLRTESLGRQSGNIPLVLAMIDNTKTPAELATAERTRFGTMTVHEIKTRAQGEEQKLMTLLQDFGYGTDDCQVFNYWDEKYPVKTSNAADVKSLLLRRNGKLMLVVCTWKRQAEQVTFDFDSSSLGVSPSRAVEADRKDALPITLTNGRLTLDLGPYDVRLLVLE